MRTAIMQPAFTPWMGYFALLSSVEHFVFLDDVKYAPQSWHSRNRIKTPHGELMLSLPINSVHSALTINHAQISPSYRHGKLLKQLSSSYSKAPYGQLSLHVIDTAFKECEYSLATFTIGIITAITKLCQFSTRLSRVSEIPDLTGTKAQRVYNICLAVNASRYVSPIGALGYLQAHNPFDNSDISLRFLNFTHPTYPQGAGHFIPNMGIIDALAWVGPEKLGVLVKNGVGDERSIVAQATCATQNAA